VAVPWEPREYVSILEGVAGGAETTARPRNGPPPRARPRDRLIHHAATLTNAPRHPSLARHSSRALLFPLPAPPPCLLPGYLVLPPSRRGSRSRPIKTLYDHVVRAQRPPPPPPPPPLRLPLPRLFSVSSSSTSFPSCNPSSTTRATFPFSRSHGPFHLPLCAASSLSSIPSRYPCPRLVLAGRITRITSFGTSRLIGTAAARGGARVVVVLHRSGMRY